MLNRHIMRTAILLLGLVIAAIGILLSGRPSNAAGPLPSGTTVIVLFDTSGNLPDPDPGPPTDMLIFTGGPTDSINFIGCFEGSYVVQNAILVDSDGGRSSRQISVFIEGTEPIPPGTRVIGFVSGVTCSVYKKYTGMVD